MARPISTYRLQIRAGFDLDAAAAVTGYLHRLGVDTVYLSPLLRATPGSDHGYDVVDVTRLDPERGGPEGLARFAAAARAAGLGILIDIVPNHLGVSQPRENPWWWDVLRAGRASAHAEAFDIDWAFGDDRVRLPVLGAAFDEVAAAGEIVIDAVGAPDAPDGVLRYFDHVFPLAAGSLDGLDAANPADPDTVRAVHARQHYELRHWRDEAAELNYRRFFAVSTLAGVRVELPEVFDAAHAEILRWVREGFADGLRVDHPDGLRDPGAYLDRLDAALRAARPGEEPYVIVEKILEHGERMPSWWATAGTTGYDALAEFARMLIDWFGLEPLADLDTRLRNESGLPAPVAWTTLADQAKREVADTILVSEVRRLVRVLPAALRERFGDDTMQQALVELLVTYPVYRSYLPAGREYLAAAANTVVVARPELDAPIRALETALADTSLEIAWRFPQTTGPVMAKGVEDTAFYRYTSLGALTEVGGDPSPRVFPDYFHEAQQARQASWPHTMTTLSTHDTKRGEDVRARLSVLAEVPERWGETLHALRAIASTGHGPFDSLLWQAIVGAWPAGGADAAYAQRLHAYAEKAAREAGEETRWLAPDAAFEARMHAVVDAATGGAAREAVQAFVDEIAAPGWSNALSQKLVQLTAPGVPDVYQGSELWELSLVDPDNRRPVDIAVRERMLAEIDAGAVPPVDGTGAAKLRVVSRALRLRRDRPELFTRYTPIEAVGAASDHVIAFDRGGALAVATRLPVALARDGGWRDTIVLVPAGAWTDVLTGRTVDGGEVALGRLLATYPVALLAREENR